MELKTLKAIYKFEDLNFGYYNNYLDLECEMNDKQNDKHRINKLISLIKDIDLTLKNALLRGINEKKVKDIMENN
jgi:hypothetical protein